MSRMAKEQVIMNVDGKPVLLKLGFNGLVELEEVVGKPIAEITGEEIAFKDLRTIFYVAIKQGGMKDITPEKTGDILDTVMAEEGIDYLGNTMSKLFESLSGGPKKSFPASKE